MIQVLQGWFIGNYFKETAMFEIMEKHKLRMR